MLYRLSYVGSKSGRRDSNPQPSAWKADALPTELLPQLLWAGMDLNHRRLTPADLQSAAIDHSATDPKNGAIGGIRTPDPLITNQPLWPTELQWQSYLKTHSNYKKWPWSEPCNLNGMKNLKQ